MRKEDVIVLNQLVFAMKDAVVQMEKYYNSKDKENLEKTKEEIAKIQKKIEALLR